MTKKLVITKNVIHRNVYYTKGEEHFLSDRDADAITSVGCGEEYTPPDIEDNTIEGRANAEVSLGVTFSGTWQDPFDLKISPTNCKVKGLTDGSEIASGTNKTINGTITEHNKELAKLKALQSHLPLRRRAFARCHPGLAVPHRGQYGHGRAPRPVPSG